MTAVLPRRSDTDPSTKSTAAARVLVVEDDIDLRVALQLQLQNADMTVETASDGHGALVAMRAFRPNLVILDLGLPGIDGIDLLDRIHASELDAPRVIVLSAWDEQRCRPMTLGRGAALHFEKPVELADLLTGIRFLLNS